MGIIESMNELWELHSKLDSYQHPDFQEMTKKLQTTIESLENETKSLITKTIDGDAE